MAVKVNLVGKTFSYLTVLKRLGTDKHKKVVYLCACKCGKEVSVVGSELSNGGTKSCGCFKAERIEQANLKHGSAREGKKSAEYRTWVGIRHRCNCETNPAYANYGGRGIKVSEHWQSFETFLADMGPRPGKDYSLDRINNDGNYESGNCRWATKREQALNTRKTKGRLLPPLISSVNGRGRTFGVSIRIGCYRSVEEAVEARDKALSTLGLPPIVA